VKTLHDEYGPIVRVGPNEVSIQDWAAYRQIYNNHNSSKTPSFYNGFSLTGRHLNALSIQDHRQHAARRKIQNPSYSQQAILNIESLITERADILVRRIINNARDSASGKTAEVYELSGLFSLEVILKCAFNRSYGDSPNGDSLTLLRAMDNSAVAASLMTSLPFLSRKNGVYIPGYAGHCFRQFDLWESTTVALLKRFQEEEAASDTAMTFLVTPMLVNEDTYLGRRLSQDELVEELMTVTFGGSGTTSTTLTYLMYALARDQSLQQRLREELQTSGESISELQKLPLLNAVIKETFRVYPTIISTLPRILDRPIMVGKILLPQGTNVGMQNYVHHRDPILFPRPDEFIPDRWLGNEAEMKDMNSALTPFSVGQRNCIGQNLARAELWVATSMIFRRLRLSLSPDMTEKDMEMEDRFNIAPRGRRLLVEIEVIN
jgi:cytochrome P450